MICYIYNYMLYLQWYLLTYLLIVCKTILLSLWQFTVPFRVISSSDVHNMICFREMLFNTSLTIMLHVANMFAKYHVSLYMFQSGCSVRSCVRSPPIFRLSQLELQSIPWQQWLWKGWSRYINKWKLFIIEIYRESVIQ